MSFRAVSMMDGGGRRPTSVNQETVTINVDKLSADLEILRNISNRLEGYYEQAGTLTQSIYADARDKGVTGFDQWLNQNYNVDGIKSAIYVAYKASLEAIDRWQSYLNDWVQLDNNLAGADNPTGKYTPERITPEMITPETQTPQIFTPYRFSEDELIGNPTPFNYTPYNHTPEVEQYPDIDPEKYLVTPSKHTPVEIIDFTHTPIGFKTPTSPYSNFTPIDIPDYHFTPVQPAVGTLNTFSASTVSTVGASTVSTVGASTLSSLGPGSGTFSTIGASTVSTVSTVGSNLGTFSSSLVSTSLLSTALSTGYPQTTLSPGSTFSSSSLFGTPTQSTGMPSVTFASSSLFSASSLSTVGGRGIGSTTFSSSSLFSASTVKGGSSTGNGTGLGAGAGSSNYASGSGASHSNMADALKRGANKLVGSILPVGKGASNMAALGSLSAAGLAAGGAAIGGGLLLGKKRNYIFKPKDFEKLDEPTQNAIIEDFKLNGFEEERIQLFKESTFCIEAKELNEHIRKVEKAYDQNADFSKEFEEMYGYKLFDNSDNLVKYLLFVALIIDGSNKTDEINIYNIINPSLEEEDVDFIYSGINMEDYIIDGEIEEDEESEEDVKVSKDINSETEEDVPQALAWLREMEANSKEEE